MPNNPSPLEQAQAAKRQRNIAGEIDALTQGCNSLENAPWYPPQPGDVVRVSYDALGESIPAWGETYQVTEELALRLLHHTSPDPSYVGFYAPGMAGDPLIEMWMEDGPHNLTIMRAGQQIHP